MSLTSKHEFLNIGRGESFIKSFYFGLSDRSIENRLFICMAIKNKQASAEIMSETVFEAGKEVFFNISHEDDYKKFEATLKEINLIFSKYQSDSISGNIGTVHMIVGAIINKTLHISQTGEGEAYLIRNKHLSVISDGLAEGGQKNAFINIASGEIEVDDIIILCSTRLLRYVTKQDLTKLFSPEGITDQELQKLKSLLEIESLDQMGINVIKVTAREEENNSKKTNRLLIQEIFSTIKNHPLIKKLSRRELEAKIEEKLEDDIDNLNANITEIKDTANNKPVFHIENFLKKIKSLRNIFVKNNYQEDTHLKKKQLLAALAGVILVLLISIVFLKINGDKQQLLDNYEKTLTEVQDDIDKAYTVGITDKQKATEMLVQAEEKTKEILQSGYLRGLATERLDSIQEIKGKLDGIKNVENPKLLADLRSTKSDINAIGLVALQNHLAAYEPTGVHEVILSKIESENTLSANEEMIDGNFFPDQNAAVFISKSNKIIEYRDGRFQFMDTRDATWKNGIDIKSFGSRIYLLDSANNQIWKYSRSRENYSGAEAYLTETTDLSNAVAMAIDGSLYVLNQDGSIRKFYAGKEEELIIRKAPLTALKSPSSIYTESEIPNLYILEPTEKRILIYSKEPKTGNLSYSYQIKFPTLDNIKDMLIDRDSNKVYLLADEKIYEESL